MEILFYFGYKINTKPKTYPCNYETSACADVTATDKAYVIPAEAGIS